MSVDELLARNPYADDRNEKNRIILDRLNVLTKYHYNNCNEYRNLIDLLYSGVTEYKTLDEIPLIPVKLFKELELVSVPREDVFKTMTSSGTTGQKVSKIFLNRTTANNQQKVLTKIVADFTGKTRMPMIILDCPSVIKDRNKFSARGAGILGFSLFGSKKIYAFNDDMELNKKEIDEFIARFKGQTIFLFGFTHMIWEYFYKTLRDRGDYLHLENGVLIHGGGWKKLINEAVSKDEFKEGISSVCGIKSIHDYYGMVEQTGCIYMECEFGHLHASVFSDVLIRNKNDFSLCKNGEKGVIQVLSTLPESYPGHSILTEDIGCVLGEDDCPCGKKGKYFEVYGRMKNAEIRGCSDTFEKKISY